MNEGGRQPALFDDSLVAVEIAEDCLQQSAALIDPLRNLLGLTSCHDVRDQVQRPGSAGAHSVIIDVIGDAVIMEQALGCLVPCLDILRVALGEQVPKGAPVGAQFTAR